MERRSFEQGEDGGSEADLRAALEAAEQRAEASHRRLEEIQSLVKVGSWEWELNSERASWSEELRRIAGLEPDAPVPTYEEFVESVHPEDQANFVASLQQAIEKGGVRTNTYRAILPDGTEKLIESHARVVTDKAGTPARIFGAAQDITDRQKVETSLRLQADLLDQVEVAVMASDTSRTLTQWNRGAEELLGVPRDEAIGRVVGEVLQIPPESNEQRTEMVRQLATGEKWEGEMTLYDSTGKTFPAYVTNAPVHDSTGRIVGYSGVIMDLSEMKRTRGELQRRVEEQAVIAALSRAAMSSDGIDALMQQAADAAADALGVEFAEVIELKSDGHGLRLCASVGPGGASVGEEDTLDGSSQAAHTLATSAPVIVEDYSREQRFKPSLGEAEHAATSGATVVIQGGDQAYGVLAAYSIEQCDFTAENIEVLQSIANVLAAAMARQRAQRLESQLHQNQRLEAVGQLAGGVAHDFNNLLVVILNYVELVHARIEDKGLREDLDEIKTAAKRAASLTHQLLVFSRREVVVPEAVDLNEAVLETEGLLRHSLREHVKLVHSCADGLWKVRLGSGQAEQILVNLLVNARDAMPKGGTVEVKTENLELGTGHDKRESLAEGKYVRLTVADTGTGMDEETAAQAFDPFFTTKKDEGGTGLGLATVYGIVKETGGTVEIYTEPGGGTALKIYLPAIFDLAEEKGDPRQAVAAAGQTILLVEDEDSVRKLAERILTEDGYQVLTAQDGVRAMAIAEQHEGDIDLLLTDVVMPHLSGPQLAKQLRGKHPLLRVLLMSGYTGEVISRHGVVEEGLVLLEKPFDSTGLLHAVSTVLHGEQGEAGQAR